MAQRFRLRSKKLFLTYPQCTVDPSEALRQLSAVVSATGHVIAREKHADGNSHLHVYLEAAETMVINAAEDLDLTVDGTTYHGNYQAVRSSSAVKKYVTKDGDFITNLNLEPSTISPWKRARDAATSDGLSAAIAILEECPKASRDLCINGDRIIKNLASLSSKKLKITYDLSTFGWTEPWDGKTHTLVIYGGTNLGKTSLAKALLPDALLTRHLDKLREYDGTRYTGIILDDMSFKHLHREAQIALVDRHEDTQVHVRYAVAEIPAGTPVIITTNSLPSSILHMDDAAIARRCYVVHMKGIGQFFKQ